MTHPPLTLALKRSPFSLGWPIAKASRILVEGPARDISQLQHRHKCAHDPPLSAGQRNEVPEELLSSREDTGLVRCSRGYGSQQARIEHGCKHSYTFSR